MATVRDAALVLVGRVVGADPKAEYVDGRPTGRTSGVAVLVKATGGGYANVTLTLEQADEIRPDFGLVVAWVVTSTPYKMENRDAAMSVRLVRPANEEDANSILQSVSVPAPAGK